MQRHKAIRNARLVLGVIALALCGLALPAAARAGGGQGCEIEKKELDRRASGPCSIVVYRGTLTRGALQIRFETSALVCGDKNLVDTSLQAEAFCRAYPEKKVDPDLQPQIEYQHSVEYVSDFGPYVSVDFAEMIVDLKSADPTYLDMRRTYDTTTGEIRDLEALFGRSGQKVLLRQAGEQLDAARQQIREAGKEDPGYALDPLAFALWPLTDDRVRIEFQLTAGKTQDYVGALKIDMVTDKP